MIWVKRCKQIQSIFVGSFGWITLSSHFLIASRSSCFGNFGVSRLVGGWGCNRWSHRYVATSISQWGQVGTTYNWSSTNGCNIWCGGDWSNIGSSDGWGYIGSCDRGSTDYIWSSRNSGTIWRVVFGGSCCCGGCATNCAGGDHTWCCIQYT